MAKTEGFTPFPYSVGVTPTEGVVLEVVRAKQYTGVTSGEVSELAHIVIGSGAGTLSRLHEKGMVARLALNRENRRIYVAPEYVGGRQVEPFGRRRYGKEREVECPNCHTKFNTQ